MFRRHTLNIEFPGGNRSRVTPVPIPNTEVKPATADGTARVTVWESRSLPGLFSGPRWSTTSAAFFFVRRDLSPDVPLYLSCRVGFVVVRRGELPPRRDVERPDARLILHVRHAGNLNRMLQFVTKEFQLAIRGEAGTHQRAQEPCVAAGSNECRLSLTNGRVQAD